MAHADQQFTSWLEDRRVYTHNVAAKEISGRGLSIVATADIKCGETIVRVPSTALLTTNSVPQTFKKLYQASTVHGLLASFLTFGDAQDLKCYDAWKTTWPSFADFQKCMPFFWPQELEQFTEVTSAKSTTGFYPLPPSLGGKWRANIVPNTSDGEDRQSMLKEQREKLQKDWQLASSIHGSQRYNDFVHNWMIVNTRCFYFDLPLTTKPRTRDDRMVLCPFLDFFNHEEQGCAVSYDATGFTVASDRDYKSGDELVVSYGGHSNDFLLIHYGFTLECNELDFVFLDDLLLNLLDETQKGILKTHGFLGNFKLSMRGVCYRTQVASRLLASPSGQSEQVAADTFLRDKVIRRYLGEATMALCLWSNLDPTSSAAQHPCLPARWGEIAGLLENEFLRLEECIDLGGGGERSEAY